jgi:hypothetical protein
MIGRKTIILCIIGAFILIGFVSQAQLSQKDERSPLYEFRAAQTAETFGLAPSGSANSYLEFGSVATAELTVQTKQPSRPTAYPRPGPKPSPSGPETGYVCYTPPVPSAYTGGCFGPRNPPESLPTGGWNCRLPTAYCT